MKALGCILFLGFCVGMGMVVSGFSNAAGPMPDVAAYSSRARCHKAGAPFPHYVSGYGPTQAEADANAMGRCSAVGGNCALAR